MQASIVSRLSQTCSQLWKWKVHSQLYCQSYKVRVSTIYCMTQRLRWTSKEFSFFYMKLFIYRAASITSVLSAHVHRGISFTVGLGFNPKSAFQNSPAVQRKIPQQLPQMSGLSFKWMSPGGSCSIKWWLNWSWLIHHLEKKKNLIHRKTS